MPNDLYSAEYWLYKNRPDLWGIAKAVKYTQGGTYNGPARDLWAQLTDADKRLIRETARGVVPEGA